MNQQRALEIMKITKNTYELIGSEFSNTRNRIWPEMEKVVKKYVKAGDKILDIGCGNGRLLEVLGEVEYLGVDGSDSLLEVLRVKSLELEAINSKLKVANRQLDILDLNKLDRKYFDIIFMFASFNHLSSQELRLKVLMDIKKLLKPSGKLIMTNWNMWQMGVKKNIWNYKLKGQNLKNKNLKLAFKDIMTVWQSGYKNKKGELYYRAFTKQELSKLFKKSGFKVLENYYSLDNKKVCWSKGKNIVTVGEIDKKFR